jgi:hypothetical protein
MKVEDELVAIYGEALGRYIKGEVKYGEYKPLTDERNLYQETIDELLDAMNYMGMEIYRLRKLMMRLATLNHG